MINNKDNNDSSAAAVADPAAPALVPVPGSTAAAASSAYHASPFLTDQDDSFRELLELCGVTPDGTPALANFDGSPMDETPLFTPALDMFGNTPFLDGWDTSPAMGDQDSFDPLPPLFSDALIKSVDTNMTENTATISDQTQLYTMPQTPALNTIEMPPPGTPTTRKSGPNGFRKGATPNTLVPLDAPTQVRQYLSDSKTARKEVPAAFQNKARKRQREDMLADDDVPEDLQDAIQAKRRLNTLAARRSRARKAQTAMENERRIEELEEQIHALRHELLRVSTERDAYRAQLRI